MCAHAAPGGAASWQREERLHPDVNLGLILGTAAVKAEGSPEAIRDEPSCSFLMKGSQEHPSAEMVVRIWEVSAG